MYVALQSYEEVVAPEDRYYSLLCEWLKLSGCEFLCALIDLIKLHNVALVLLIDNISLLVPNSQAQYMFSPHTDYVVGIGLQVECNEVVPMLAVVLMLHIQLIIVVEEILQQQLLGMLRVLQQEDCVIERCEDALYWYLKGPEQLVASRADIHTLLFGLPSHDLSTLLQDY